MYSAESWPLIAASLKRLQGAHHRLQRSVISVSWKDKLTNQEVRAKTKQHSIASSVSERRLHWAWSCAANRSPAHSTASITLGGSRLQDGIGSDWPRTNWRGIVEKDLQKMGLTREEEEVAALDRSQWCQRMAKYVYGCGMNQWPRISGTDEPRDLKFCVHMEGWGR